MIEVEGLTFKYVGRREPTLRDVSLRIPAGQSVLVLGPSGCGKSTLALCLNGAIPHAAAGDLAGTVRIGGTDTRRASMADLAQRVGMVFQDPEAQFCMLTVEDEVAFGLENLAVPRAEMSARIDAALGQVGLARRRRERIERLSGGQKQRLALACVLAQEPEVIVLDEPTAQLDPAGAADVMALLGQLRARGRHTLVIVEHRLDEVVPLVDRAIVLDAGGTLVADGEPREVIRAHGQALTTSGVWTPQVSELALGLERAGIVLRPFPLTVPEAVEALRPHVGRLGGGISANGAHPPHDGHAANGMQPSGAAARPVAEARPLVEVRGLSFQYPRAAAPVLRDVTCSFRPGEIVAVVGANGAGKSTLARLVAGINRPPRGTIRVDGRDVADARLPILARDVGYVFQYPEHQFVGQTALDDVAFGPRRAGLPEAEAVEQARAMLADFGLLRLAAAHPFTLSHGEQRRLSVASMLVLGQRVLLLDEPTYGQDQRNATMLLDKLEALADAGRAIVAISHDMRLVAERARRVLVMAEGRIVFDGPPARLFADEALLARAGLTPPPLWEVGRRLGLRRPVLGVRDALRRLGAPTPLGGAPSGRPTAAREMVG